MRMTIKKYGLAALICAVVCLSFIPLSFGEGKIPKPGTVIDKSNYMEYKHLFPEEHLHLFTDMWGLGLEPFSITVGESKPAELLREENEANENNRGKYQLDAEGYVNAPSESIVGQPFYGMDPSDPNYAQKFMWNYYYRYVADDSTCPYYSQFTKRRDEKSMGFDKVGGYTTAFTGRLVLDPKPYLKNTNNLRFGLMMFVQYPPVNKNIINLMWTPLDPRLENPGFVYVPAFRRILRSESSERSVPINNSTQAPDDFYVFMGRIPEFNFKVIREQTVLAVKDSKIKPVTLKNYKQYKTMPFDKVGWEPRDVLVIEITPKNPAYPQSRKRIYIDKVDLTSPYGIAWDRAGSLWKVWMQSFVPQPMTPDGRKHVYQYMQWGADLQMGYATFLLRGRDTFNSKPGYTEGDYTTSGIRGLVQ